MTPRQFSALLQRRRQEMDFQASLNALLPWLQANSNRGNAPMVKFETFVLTRQPAKPRFRSVADIVKGIN